MKIEKSRRVVESHPVCLDLKMMTKELEKETLDVTDAIEALKITGENIQRIRESDTVIWK